MKQSFFFLSILKLWDDLNTGTRNIPTVLQFKTSVRHQPLKVSEHLSAGGRKYNIILSRIRHMYSSLNAALIKVSTVLYSNCSIDVLFESAEHLFPRVQYSNTKR